MHPGHSHTPWPNKPTLHTAPPPTHHHNHQHTEATKRGLGAALLKKPTKLAKMVAGIAAAVDLPVTVKIRTGGPFVCRVGSCVGTLERLCAFEPQWWRHQELRSLAHTPHLVQCGMASLSDCRNVPLFDCLIFANNQQCTITHTCLSCRGVGAQAECTACGASVAAGRSSSCCGAWPHNGAAVSVWL